MKTQSIKRFWTRFLRICRGTRPEPQHRRSYRPEVEILEARIVLDDNALGPKGIDALAVDLTGLGIVIGQIEENRPGRQRYDRSRFHRTVFPRELYVGNRDAPRNEFIDRHSLEVAAVMIGNGIGRNTLGVAPNARLSSSALDPNPRWTMQQSYGVSIQHLINQHPDIRAINFSAGARAEPGRTRLDGNNTLTQVMDWSARTNDILYVVAGPYARGRDDSFVGLVGPDQYNGVVVGMTTSVRNDIFNSTVRL